MLAVSFSFWKIARMRKRMTACEKNEELLKVAENRKQEVTLALQSSSSPN
jgi:hypothetical protein